MCVFVPVAWPSRVKNSFMHFPRSVLACGFFLIWNSQLRQRMRLRPRPAAEWRPLCCHSKGRVRAGGEGRQVISPSAEWQELELWVHLFNQYLLSNYCVPDTGLGAGFVAVNMIEITRCSESTDRLIVNNYTITEL